MQGPGGEVEVGRQAESARLACLALALLPGLALTLFYEVTARRLAGHSGFPLDDSWIHAQFARNIATGQGFTYTGDQWVAGSTAPAWTLLLAFGYAVVPRMVLVAKFLGFALQASVGILSARLVRELGGRSIAQVAVAAAACAVPVMVWGAVSGMEVCLASALVLLGLLWHCRDADSASWRTWRGVVVLCLACLARPENLVVLALVVPDLVSRAHTGRSGTKRSAVTLVVVATLLIPWVAFDYATIDRPLPTTFYAKSGPGILRAVAERDVDMARRAVLVHGPHAVWNFVLVLDDQLSYAAWVVPVGLLVALFRREHRRNALVLAALLILVPYAIGTTSPQRLKPENVRYVPQLVALSVVVAGLAWSSIRWRGAGITAGALAAAFVGVIGYQAAGGARTYGLSVKNIEELHVTAAKWVNAALRPGSTVGANDVGALAYFGQRPVVDIEGLVTPKALWYKGPGRGLRFLNDARPEYLLIFPGWYPEVAKDAERFRELQRFRIVDNRVSASDSLVLYQTPWARQCVLR